MAIETPSSAGPDVEHVGAVLRLLREEREVRAVELARGMRISHSHLANIEAGRKRLTRPLAARAAELLGVRPAALISPRLVAGDEADHGRRSSR